jgi:hypothetical protein
MANLPVLSFTKIHLRRTCGLAFRRRYIDHAPEPASAPAETGVGFHSWTEELERASRPGTSLDEDLAAWLLTRKAAMLHEAPAEDLRNLVRRVLARGGLPAYPSDVQDQAYERRLALTAEGKPCGWDDPQALFRLVMDQAWRENGGKLACVSDWKTGRRIEPPGDQLRYYAWAVSCLWTEVEEVVGRNFWLRFSSRPDAKLFNSRELRETVPAELQAIRDDLARREKSDEWEPRVSDACRTCAFVTSCKAFRSGIKPFKVVENEDQARTAARQLVIAEGHVRVLKDSLKAWFLERGPLDLGDDEEYAPRPRTDFVVTDARLAARLFRARGVPEDEVWGALAVRKGAVSSLIFKACDSAEGREALQQELVAAGVAEFRNRDGGLKRRKKLPPEGLLLEGTDEEEDYDA